MIVLEQDLRKCCPENSGYSQDGNGTKVTGNHANFQIYHTHGMIVHDKSERIRLGPISIKREFYKLKTRNVGAQSREWIQYID